MHSDCTELKTLSLINMSAERIVNSELDIENDETIGTVACPF